ncbi:hemerythrin family protein [Myxococcota bacterium]|nr:hemerythrin family protein [Myxococcota bacterium]
MSSLIEWDPGLVTGHTQIDKQHRAFFERANHIITAVEAGSASEHIERLIGFLDDYVLWHFTSEELLMEKYDYPAIREHQKSHSKFSKSVEKLRRELEKKGVGKHLVSATHQTVVLWFIEHIANSDKDLAEYIAAKKS